MSLLEDIFLQDEAGEARELERIIDGDEYDETPRSPQNSDDNSEKEDEAEEDKRRVDPATTKTKREVKNPRFVLNPARLTGPRGIQVIPEHFKDFKFKGKGHEKEDLDIVLKKLEHWAYRLYPKFQFEDCLKKIETLGRKRPVMVHLHKIRSDQLATDEAVVQHDSSDDDTPAAAPQAPEEDEFDKLLQQQIELARATPASARKPEHTTPATVRPQSTPAGDVRPPSLPLVPKATSSPSISNEQRERMLLNRKLAEERRLAKLRALSDNQQSVNNDNNIETLSKNESSRSVDKSTFKTDKVTNNVQSHESHEVNNQEMNDVDDNDVILNSVKKTVTSKNIETVDLLDTYGFENSKQAKSGQVRSSPSQTKHKKNKSNVIDSDSDTSDNEQVNEMVTVDVQLHQVASQVDCSKDSEIPVLDLIQADTYKAKEMDGKIIIVEDQANPAINESANDIIDITGESKKPDQTRTFDIISDSEIPVVDLVNTDNTTKGKEMDGKIIIVEDHANPILKESANDTNIMDIIGETNKPDQTSTFDIVEDCVLDSEKITDETNSNCNVATNDRIKSGINEQTSSENIEIIQNKVELHEEGTATKELVMKYSETNKTSNEGSNDIDFRNTETCNSLKSNKDRQVTEEINDEDKIDMDVGKEMENIDDIMDVDFDDDF